jgi:ABC-type transporter Mla subunit MlaD
MKIMIDGVLRDATPEEITQLNKTLAVTAEFLEPAAPTKEQLLAQLNALSAQIQALE